MGNRQEMPFGKVNILWLDAKINNEQNMEYQKEIKKIKGVIFKPFTEIKECIKIIKEIRYEKTFIIISGSILKDFYEKFENIINEIEILPEILIFTSHKRAISVMQYISNLKCSLFDANSIYTYYDGVEKRLKMENLYIPKTNNNDHITIENDDIFTFEYIQESKELIFPLYCSKYIEYPTKYEISKFNKFLLDNYSNLNNLILQLILNKAIPCEILIKYYLRAYTLESDFYKEMNYCLERNLGKKYETYIEVVYHSLLQNYILPAQEKKLYRGSRIKRKELEYINNSFKYQREGLPACICFNKSFLSSSYREDVALRFMIRKKKKENEEYVIYEFEKGTELDKGNASNSNISIFSAYKDEKEILFFPFSSFEINKIAEERTLIKDNEYYTFYRVYLNYLGKYKKKLNLSDKIPKNKFTQSYLETDYSDKHELSSKTQILSFDFDVKTYITEEQKRNYIQATYEINKNDINKKINILNCSDLNKEEIKSLCNIKLDNKKIDFCLEYKFDKEGKYTFKIEFNDLLTNASKLFYNCKNLISLDFSNFKTNNITDMSDMFNGCSLIKSIDLSNFKTNHLTNMKNMFNDCTSLINLDVSSSSLNTIYVTDMSSMFGNCVSLYNLDLSNFKTKSVENMSRMFYNCKALTFLNISNFSTELVKNMSEMFSQCSSLESLDLSKFDTFNVTEMNNMFYQCSSLVSVNLSNFNTGNVNTMENMFTECSLLKSLDLSSFETKEVTNMKEMFKKCSSLETLNLQNFDNRGVKNMKNMFTECNSLNTLIMSKSFTYKNYIFEDINKEAKIIYDGTELNVGDIIEFFNDDDYYDDKKSNISKSSSNTKVILSSIFREYADNNGSNNNN